MPWILRLVLAAAAIGYFLFQVRKPGRLLGPMIARAMNQTHSALTDWGLTHVAIEKHFTMLDVGCGGGATVRKLALLAPEGAVHGVDYSAASVAVAADVNHDLGDRVKLHQATVSQLPFPDATFDLVTAVETQYYWPDLPADMREILRVLKPGGSLLVVAESYKGGHSDWWQRPIMSLLGTSHLDVAAHRDLFASAGYDEVEINEHPKGWICVSGRKPL